MSTMETAGPAKTRIGSLWPTIPFVLYAIYSAARHDLRPEHVLLVIVVTAMSLGTPKIRELLYGLLPYAFVGILFDGMRPFQKLGLTESRVLVCSLRDLEATFFGWGSGDAKQTIHDYFYVHHTPLLDFYAAFPYGTFIIASAACSVWLYVKDRDAMRRFAWVFLLMNIAAFITYHVLPAAPPWYFHERGCVVDLSTRASEGPALARVDQMMGIGYFKGMYGKAASVFGALPSLHCAYPFLIVVQGWKTFSKTFRGLALFYWASMVFAAVYLDHHWVLDALLGTAYAAIASVVVAAVQRRLAARRPQEVAAATTTESMA